MGASWDGHGVNFAVFSAHARAMEVCIFDPTGTRELARLRLPAHTGDVWHGYLPGAQPGLVYGLRAHGLWDPTHGHRFNPNKLLLDPYAREIHGTYAWRDEHFGFDRQNQAEMDLRDNAAFALKASVVQDDFDWEDDRPPHIAMQDTVLYEVHVKGFTQNHPGVPKALRGTYAGLSHPAALAHIKSLGVTTLSLLPVHFSLDEERLVQRGLTNYWGYNTLGFFAPNTALASARHGSAARDEFRSMVKAIHAQGMEVMLDVVYNHTAESDESGPHLSFRGLDNASYYRLRSDNHAFYENYSGCGNSLDIREPRVLQLVMDSLRYWVTVMHVDGFRFDLAPVLSRGDHGFERGGAFFSAIAQDPVLSRVTMIAEPWDVGPGGYQVGSFPSGWMEWNDRFRDVMRGFWLRSTGPSRTRGEFALRLCGSSDLYQHGQRRQRPPADSVNYIVSHDGFTLRDLVSYNQRHNLANGESNADGHGNNLSNNCGAEGPSTDPAVTTLRARLQRVLLATTLLAQGTPMLCAGDELGHTQNGNNNPYCQDNEITWIDWEHADTELIAFTTAVLTLRRQTQPLGIHWYSGLPTGNGLADLTWLQADGQGMGVEAWNDPLSGVLGCLIGKPDRTTQPMLLLFNPHGLDRVFRLPAGAWRALLDTTHPAGLSHWQGEGSYPLQAHSLVALERLKD